MSSRLVLFVLPALSVLLFTGGLFRSFRLSRKIETASIHLRQLQDLRKKEDLHYKKAIGGASVVNEIAGWRRVPKTASTAIGAWQRSGKFQLISLSLERSLFSISSPGGIPEQGLPPPTETLCLHEVVSVNVAERKAGEGSSSIAKILDQLRASVPLPLHLRRVTFENIPEEERPPLPEKTEWIIESHDDPIVHFRNPTPETPQAPSENRP